MPHRKSPPLVVAVLVVCLAGCAGCQSAPGRPADSPPRHSKEPRQAATTAALPPATTSLVAARQAVGAVWLRSEAAFYRAGQLGAPDYAPLLATFAPGAPALAGTVSYLSSLATVGLRAPAHYRIGAVRVSALTATRASLTACSYDTGSRYAGTGEPAPPTLGGGAGYTGYLVTEHLVGGRWLVWSARSFAVRSPTEAGPCRGF